MFLQAMRRLPITAVLLLAGCSPLEVLNTFVPSSGHSVTENIAYGPLPRQKLDVYHPRGVKTPAPVVVFFYGGRWQDGSREGYRFVAQALTSRGFVAVLPDYRLYPEVEFPAFVKDGAKAFAWVRQNIRRYGGDPDEIFLMGHSAGAHIAALLATDERYLREVGVDPDALRGFIGLAGPYDFLPFEDADIRALMGPPERWPATQPVNFVDGGEPPMLLLRGEEDETVKPRNAARLAERVREAGGEVEVVIYSDLDHIEILLPLAAPFRWLAPVLDDVADFVREESGSA